ncbi:MAG: type VI secretion system baseplate subunit TssE [Gemmatimonadetes bacterium]|nr:type VI secretion system baseplate subunit TssE [Gemmatimonadota bacterium]
MANREVERTVRQSVLDRLIDFEPKQSADASTTWAESVRQLKESVLRDLEWLLNTRRTPETAPDAYAEVKRSVFHYGLPDITSLSGESEVVRRRLIRQVEECIQLFEPRLTGVRVSPVEVEEESKRRIRFIIEAILRMEPNPERVTFDTVLEISSGKFLVTGERSA